MDGALDTIVIDPTTIDKHRFDLDAGVLSEILERTRRLVSARNQESLFEEIVSSAMSTFHADEGYLVTSANGLSMNVAVARTVSGRALGDPLARPNLTVLYRTLLHGEAVLRAVDEDSVMSVPLRQAGRVRAALVICTRGIPPRYSVLCDLLTLILFAEQAAIGMHIVGLHNDNRAIRDKLMRANRQLSADISDSPVRTLEQVEAKHILDVFQKMGRHRGRTADSLGIGKTTLWRKLKAYGR